MPKSTGGRSRQRTTTGASWTSARTRCRTTQLRRVVSSSTHGDSERGSPPPKAYQSHCPGLGRPASTQPTVGACRTARGWGDRRSEPADPGARAGGLLVVELLQDGADHLLVHVPLVPFLHEHLPLHLDDLLTHPAEGLCTPAPPLGLLFLVGPDRLVHRRRPGQQRSADALVPLLGLLLADPRHQRGDHLVQPG